MVEQRYIINSDSVKTRSLEWCVPTPVPAHTFVVPIKCFTTAAKFFKYRRGTKVYNHFSQWAIPYITILKSNKLNKKNSTMNIQIFLNNTNVN